MIQDIGRIKELMAAPLYTRNRADSIDITLIRPGRALVRPAIMVAMRVK